MLDLIDRHAVFFAVLYFSVRDYFSAGSSLEVYMWMFAICGSVFYAVTLLLTYVSANMDDVEVEAENKDFALEYITKIFLRSSYQVKEFLWAYTAVMCGAIFVLIHNEYVFLPIILAMVYSFGVSVKLYLCKVVVHLVTTGVIKVESDNQET